MENPDGKPVEEPARVGREDLLGYVLDMLLELQDTASDAEEIALSEAIERAALEAHRAVNRERRIRIDRSLDRFGS